MVAMAFSVGCNSQGLKTFKQRQEPERPRALESAAPSKQTSKHKRAGALRCRAAYGTVSTAPAAGAPSEASSQQAPIRIPRNISEVDNGKVMGFGADLAEDHPGGPCLGC